MIKALRSKKMLALAILLMMGTAWSGVELFAASLVSDVDPNILKAECPGGEWDRPGSSCHDGIIADNVFPPYAPYARTPETSRTTLKPGNDKRKGR